MAATDDRLLAALLTHLTDQLGQQIVHAAPVSGGDFASSYRVTLADGTLVFAKTHRQPPPSFFSTEATGLSWLRSTHTVRVPEVLVVSDQFPAHLVLEWIAESPTATDDANFGRALARLHRHPWPTFGRTDHRTTGSLALPNEPTTSWPEFFRSNRLEPLVGKALRAQVLSTEAATSVATIGDRLPNLVPDDRPSLVHGDLWAGNRIADSEGRSWVIDPAAHGNHRE